MDAKIRQLEKQNKKEGKGLKQLEKLDKKRDKVCELGEKVKAKKGRKNDEIFLFCAFKHTMLFLCML